MTLPPFAKALVPIVLTPLGALAQALIAGQLDAGTVTVALLGLASAVGTYLVPNRSAVLSPPPAPAAPPAPPPPPGPQVTP